MIKKGDFVEIEYTARLQEDNAIFDTTDEIVAKAQGFYNKSMSYGPITIVVGQSHVLKALDEQILGKETGEYKISLDSEHAFGKKSAKLLQLVSTSKFHKQNIMPQPGLQVNIDDAVGIVRIVTGGRTIVDFNHPLAGKDVLYDIKILRIVTDAQEKVKALAKIELGIDANVSVEENTAKIELPSKIDNSITEEFKNRVLSLTGLKDVVFEILEEKKQEARTDLDKEKLIIPEEKTEENNKKES